MVIKGASRGEFLDSNQLLGDSLSEGISLGDVDGDDDLDAFVGNRGGNRVWINQGGGQNGMIGQFLGRGQLLGNSSSEAVELRDLDGDGDLAAYVANDGSQANWVWINGGGIQGGIIGEFVDGGQGLGDSSSLDVSLGDVNGDGSIDAFVANNGANTVWFNTLPATAEAIQTQASRVRRPREHVSERRDRRVPDRRRLDMVNFGPTGQV